MNSIRTLHVALYRWCLQVADFPKEPNIRPRDTIGFALGVEAEFERDIFVH